MICVDNLDLESLQVAGRFRGRAKTVRSQIVSGRYVKAAPLADGERDFDIAADATIRSALLRQAGSGRVDALSVRAGDLHKKIYQRHVKSLIVFVVDCSESMGEEGAQERIRAAKGTILGILTTAYQKRYRVGLVSFFDESAEVVLPPTSSVTMARRSLHSLPVGGATPFAHGLMKAWQMIRTERIKDHEIRPLLVILSDGEANVPYDPELPHSRIAEELMQIAGRIGGDRVSSLVIETRPLRSPSDTMRRLAESLGGRYYHSTTFKNSDLLRTVAAF
ncbi:MAG: VWA domain-containing protein [Desulfofustis sp.]|nr:VWA domain-containing protein [Desulfofustis sp.]